MSDYGVTVRGAAGNELIGGSALTMAFLAKGSVTLDQEQAHYTAPYFDRAYLGSSPAQAGGGMLCAFRPRFSDRPVGVWEFFPETGTTYFVGHSQDGSHPIVDWWMFGKPTAGATGWGAEAYHNGQVTWSSAYKPMEIAAVVNDGERVGISAGRTGDWAICVGLPSGAVRSGSETSSSGMFTWLETRLLWFPPTSTGFNAPTSWPVALGGPSGSYPTGWREGDMRATQLLVDVAGL